MTRRTRILLATLMPVLAASVLGACGGGSAGRERVTVVLDWTPNTNHSGVYLARDRGLYADRGLEVSVVEPDQSGAIAQVAAGNAQFGFGAEGIAAARAQGTPVRAVAAVLQTNTSSLIAPADRGIRRPRDLEGRTYGTYGGEIERPLIEALVRCDGGDPSTVRFVEVGNVDYTVGFRRGRYDAVWVFDGWDTIRMRDLAKVPVTTIPFRDHLDCIPDWYTPNLFTTDRVLADDPDLVRRFLAATAEGYRIAARDPEAAAAAIRAAAPESDPALLSASARFLAPYLLDDAGRWGTQDPAVWERFVAFLRRSAITTSPAGELFAQGVLPPS